MERSAKGERAQHRGGDRLGADGRIGPPRDATACPMNGREDRVATAYIEACLAELDAPKPGNVDRFAPGHGMSLVDFVRSAEASAAPIAAKGARVGVRVRSAVEATLSAVGQNTNLGIILLCAPLAAAMESAHSPLRPALAGVLDSLDRSDAADVFSAIAAANPGGTRSRNPARRTRSCRRDAARGHGGGGGAGSHRAAIRHSL